MKAFTSFTSRFAPLPVDDIDTDQIIPARFLKTTDKIGLGSHLFTDWRYNPDGSPKAEFILNRPEFRAARILLAGRNFGCGSSREHAPWALMGFGFQAVVAASFADIFRNNALKNGLLPIQISQEECARLLEMPEAQLTVDLANQQVILPDGRGLAFPIDNFSKTCLLNGVDELGYLIKMEERIAAYERSTANG